MNDDRPAKRIRQACEPCRRKKSKCSGERPICSTCWRLEQQCFYNGDPLQLLDDSAANVRSARAASHAQVNLSRPVGSPSNLDDRMATLESTVHRILDTLQANTGTAQSVGRQNPSPDAHSIHGYVAESRVPPLKAIIGSQPSSMHMRSMLSGRIEMIGEVYLALCADQPLPLFPRDGFVESLLARPDATLFAIVANSLRHASGPEDNFSQRDSHIFRDASHSRIMADIGDGDADLSTLQALCLIVVFDFANGRTKTAASLMALASMLVSNVGQWTCAAELRGATIEERNCCYWSVVLLQRLLGITAPLATSADVRSIPYPNSCSMPQCALLRPEVRRAYELAQDDSGVMILVIEMSVEWLKVMSYIKDCLSFTPDTSPWLTSSRYASALAGVMSIETRLQPLHRYKHISFRDLALKDLEERREYWAPWLLSRFLYHTMICLLNHPLLVTLQLQSKGNDSELFREQSSFYVARHVHWILHFIAFVEARKFRITDPVIGYCAAVVATIESQLIYSVDEVTAEKKQRNIQSCRRLIRSLAPSYALMADLDRKVGDLSTVISTTYTFSMNSTSSVAVDLSKIRDILEICPQSFTRRTPILNTDKHAPRNTGTGMSPPQWVRLSRRPSVDQPDEGAPLPQDIEHVRNQDFIMPPQASVETGASHIIPPDQYPANPFALSGFPADLFFNGISQDVSSWWSGFETYDPDCPSF